MKDDRLERRINKLVELARKKESLDREAEQIQQESLDIQKEMNSLAYALVPAFFALDFADNEDITVLKDEFIVQFTWPKEGAARVVLRKIDLVL